jgi:hypothetical protein
LIPPPHPLPLQKIVSRTLEDIQQCIRTTACRFLA